MQPETAYLVAAGDRQPGPPRAKAHGEPWRRDDDEVTWQPVGVRHAVRLRDAHSGGPRKTLCGQVADNWYLWTDLVLDGSHGGDCRRCTQMTLK